MRNILLSGLFIAATTGALVAAPAAGSALAAPAIPAHQQFQVPGWGGYDNPGWVETPTKTADPARPKPGGIIRV